MLKRMAALLVLAGSLLLLALPAWAGPKIPPVPTHDVYAQDYAKVLSGETRSRINRLSSELNAKTKAQIAVVTIPSLSGEPIEEFSLDLFRKWGIGDRQLNNGVLILVSVEEKKSRIEVGYGLEGALPDAKTGRIQDEAMRPGIEAGDYNTALMNGYTAVLREVAKEYEGQIKSSTRAGPKNRASTGIDFWDALPLWAQLLAGIVLILLVLIDWFVLGGFFTRMLFIFASSGRGGGGGRGGGFGGGSGGGGGSSR